MNMFCKIVSLLLAANQQVLRMTGVLKTFRLATEVHDLLKDKNLF
jgi:hypothetical protein